MIMEIYHLAMTQNYKVWTITRTAEHFGVSIGLVSENLRLAHAIHIDPTLITIPLRQDAIKKLPPKRSGYSNGRDVETET